MGLSLILASIVPTPEEIDSSQTLVPSATPMDWTPAGRPRAKSQPGPPRIQTDFATRYSTISGHRSRTRSPSPTQYPAFRRPSASHLMPSFSLIGALEFRQVVASLASQAAGDPLNLNLYQESPLTPYVRGHYPHHHSHPSTSRPRTPEQDPWDIAGGVQLHERSPRISPTSSVERLDRMMYPSNVPSETDTSSHRFTPPSKPQKVKHALYRTWHTLFPTLHHFWDKSFLGKIVALFAAPAVMALTITLPVVVTPYAPERPTEKPPTIGGSGDSRLVDFEEEGVEVERALIAEEEVVEELHELKYNKWLMAAQCIFGPLWCVAVLFGRFIPTCGVCTGANGRNVGARRNGARDVVVACHNHRRCCSSHPRPDILHLGGASDHEYPTVFDGILRRYHLDHGHR